MDAAPPPMSLNLARERRGYVPGGFGQLHYRELGDGEPYLLIHQVPWSSLQYHRGMPVLAAAGLRVVAPDLPGYGMSDGPPAPITVEAYADILARMLDGLGIERAAVGGHHTGALIAARLAAAHPDRVTRLVIDNGPLWTAEERAERRARPAYDPSPAPDGGHFAKRWAKMRQIGDPEWSDASVHLAVLSFYNNGASADYGYWAAYRYDLAPDLARIACPTLLLAGTRDPLYSSAARLRAARPDFAYAEFDGGAGVQLERPDDWAGPIARFLKAR